MSNTVESGIFSDIIGYFSTYLPSAVENVASVQPLSGAILRHYHRPNLEKNLVRPCVATVHHDLEDDDPSLDVNNFLDRYREADNIICLNTLQQRFLARVGITNTIVIPHGHNDRFIACRGGMSDVAYNTGTGSGENGRIVIGVLSRRYPRKVKGEGYIYELLQHLDPRFFELVLIGRGRTYDAAILERYGYKVTAYESIPYRAVAGVYGYIDVLLMASWHEGGPANIPEAVAAGVPVLCNPVGMAYDLISDEENGLHLTMNPANDAARILEWVGDAKRLHTLRRGAMCAASRAITWQQHVQRTVDVYRSVIRATVGDF
ncbi:glycosyltransferase family 4 protein [Variovorax sp. J31P179]|uniref:glycosyltransferase family 4 protein n=1 Tax=Variovorax sp. J31P179 TaxID=3053508 RepID=UPI002577E1D2|nr:glycosyltransferase family 4 protein [Variovorax sp. J31P179]